MESSEILLALQSIESRLAKIEKQNTAKEFYTTLEIAQLIGKEQFTVREWCRKGRVNAEKRQGRGSDGEWRISHDELERIRNHGLLVQQRQNGLLGGVRK